MVIRQLLLLVTRHLRKYLVNQSTFDKKSLLNHTLFCTESPTPTPTPVLSDYVQVNSASICVFLYSTIISILRARLKIAECNYAMHVLSISLVMREVWPQMFRETPCNILL